MSGVVVVTGRFSASNVVLVVNTSGSSATPVDQSGRDV
jgi:hypothetical protein